MRPAGLSGASQTGRLSRLQKLQRTDRRKNMAEATQTNVVGLTQARASWGRWYILVVISVMYLVTYLDRVNISTAAPLIRQEFGFDQVTMAWIFSAFVWAYALFQVPGGWLADRFGPRAVLTGIVAYWS